MCVIDGLCCSAQFNISNEHSSITGVTVDEVVMANRVLWFVCKAAAVLIVVVMRARPVAMEMCMQLSPPLRLGYTRKQHIILQMDHL